MWVYGGTVVIKGAEKTGPGRWWTWLCITYVLPVMRFCTEHVCQSMEQRWLIGNKLLGPRSAKKDPAGAWGNGGPHLAGPGSPPKCACCPAGAWQPVLTSCLFNALLPSSSRIPPLPEAILEHLSFKIKRNKRYTSNNATVTIPLKEPYHARINDRAVMKGKLSDNNTFLFKVNTASLLWDFTRQSFMTTGVCFTDFRIISIRNVLLHSGCLIFVRWMNKWNQSALPVVWWQRKSHPPFDSPG